MGGFSSVGRRAPIKAIGSRRLHTHGNNNTLGRASNVCVENKHFAADGEQPEQVLPYAHWSSTPPLFRQHAHHALCSVTSSSWIIATAHLPTCLFDPDGMALGSILTQHLNCGLPALPRGPPTGRQQHTIRQPTRPRAEDDGLLYCAHQYSFPQKLLKTLWLKIDQGPLRMVQRKYIWG